MINNVGALDDWERGSLSAYIVSHRRRCYYVSAGINSRRRQRLKYNINCHLRCSRSNRLPCFNRHNIRCVDLEYCRAMLKAFCKLKITLYHPITHSSHFCLVFVGLFSCYICDFRDIGNGLLPKTLSSCSMETQRLGSLRKTKNASHSKCHKRCVRIKISNAQTNKKKKKNGKHNKM